MCRVRAYWWKDAGIEDFEQLMRVRRATVCSEANAGAGMPAGVRKGRDFVRDESSEREKLVLAAAHVSKSLFVGDAIAYYFKRI